MIVSLELGVCSCEPAFPNDKLDFYWRLDRIEYKGGINFKGENCEYDDIDDTMFGFSRHIVLIEDLTRGFSRHGITTEFGDSIRLDFSIYDDYTLTDSLRLYGLDSVVTTFKVEYPDRQRLVLSSNKAVLKFRKW